MPPRSMEELFNQFLGLISGAFSSAFNLTGSLFTIIIRISPLPDEVDFLLICLLLIWLTSFLIRAIRGK
jgi:hypothetical protein